MSRHRAIAPLLVIGLGSAALAGCVSKSTFLQKVDEWVRVRSQLESCDKEMGRAAEFRATLETDLKASERRTALCQLEKKAVSVTVDDKAKLETELKAEIEGLRGKYKTIADDMNELRAKHGTADETIRGLQKRLRELRVEARREPDLSDVRKALRTEVDESNGLLSVSLPKGAVVLRIPHSQLFAKRNALLSREGKELIARLADSLRRLKDRSFLVQGHQDASAQAGDAAGSLPLSSGGGEPRAHAQRSRTPEGHLRGARRVAPRRGARRAGRRGAKPPHRAGHHAHPGHRDPRGHHPGFEPRAIEERAMSDGSDVQNLHQLFNALTVAGEYGLQVLHSQDASEVARADASAVVDLTTRKLHELLDALDDDHDA